MRLIDADKMLEDMENGKAPLIGYIPHDWILSQPTVRPEEMQFISRDDVRPLVQDLLNDDYWVKVVEHKSGQSTATFKPVSEFRSFADLVKLSDSLFIDPKPLRDSLLEILWIEAMHRETGKPLIVHPSFVKLVDIAFPDWDVENKARAVKSV